jgi:hypothetical protein
MKSNNTVIVIIAALLLIFSLACGFSVSTANIKNAFMAREVDGELVQVGTYASDEVFLCTADLANSPEDTVVTASWYVVEAEGVDPNFLIEETSITSGSNQLFFDLSNNMLWPSGSYRVDLSIGDEVVETVEFQVQ